MRAGRQLAAADIKFQPGINEELAATALWGTQQAELRGEGKFDGVFGLWYGKGPGVDRSGDVFRHANLAGTSKNGGVLALMGDDHTAESSTTAHQSEFHFVDVMMPILNPAGVQEIIDYALYGWAMSRYTGTWTALKCMHETVESTGVVDGSLDRVQDRHAERLPHAGGRAQHPPGRHHPRPGSAPARFQARRHARLRARQQAQQDRHLRRPQSEDRHHHHRQGLSRRAPGARRARPRRGQVQRSRHPPVQDRLRLADRPAGTGRVRAGARSHHRGRGEALADRSAGARGTVRQRQSAGLHRQEGRAGQLAVPGQGRARSQRRRGLHRRAAAALRRQRRTGGQCGAAESRAARARRDRRRGAAHSLFLLGLSAQHLDPRAGRQPRLCRHRLPLHGAMDGPRDAGLHPDGRRGRQLDRRGAVLQARPRVPESGRRHLQSLRQHRHPRRHRLRREHDLQDSVQRRGGDDRRPGQ